MRRTLLLAVVADYCAPGAGNSIRCLLEGSYILKTSSLSGKWSLEHPVPRPTSSPSLVINVRLRAKGRKARRRAGRTFKPTGLDACGSNCSSLSLKTGTTAASRTSSAVSKADCGGPLSAAPSAPASPHTPSLSSPTPCNLFSQPRLHLLMEEAKCSKGNAEAQRGLRSPHPRRARRRSVHVVPSAAFHIGIQSTGPPSVQKTREAPTVGWRLAPLFQPLAAALWRAVAGFAGELLSSVLAALQYIAESDPHWGAHGVRLACVFSSLWLPCPLGSVWKSHMLDTIGLWRACKPFGRNHCWRYSQLETWRSRALVGPCRRRNIHYLFWLEFLPFQDPRDTLGRTSSAAQRILATITLDVINWPST
jgi:hypothetical protein